MTNQRVSNKGDSGRRAISGQRGVVTEGLVRQNYYRRGRRTRDNTMPPDHASHTWMSSIASVLCKRFRSRVLFQDTGAEDRGYLCILESLLRDNQPKPLAKTSMTRRGTLTAKLGNWTNRRICALIAKISWMHRIQHSAPVE